MRAFGAEVDARGAASAASDQMMRACTEVVSRAVPELLQWLTDHMTAHIDQRLDMLGQPRHVNLNVRAPKRSGPYSPPIARNISGQPFPIAKYLDEQERRDPTWKQIRRSFAPTFSMLCQILKKRSLKESGEAAVYVEQLHRPQLFYTVDDRPLMDEAWVMSAAHREDLSGKRYVVAPVSQPSVLALLRRQ